MLSLVPFTCCDKTLCTKLIWGWEGLIWLPLPHHSSPLRSSKGTEAQNMEECSVLAHFQVHTQLALPWRLRPNTACPCHGVDHSGLCPCILISNRDNPCRHFHKSHYLYNPSVETPFLDHSKFCRWPLNKTQMR